MSLVIELIESLPEHFKIEHIAGILAGVPNALIKSYHHDKLDLFGAGKDHDVRFWSAVIHQGLVLHYLDKDIDNYGLIRATDQGLRVSPVRTSTAVRSAASMTPPVAPKMTAAPVDSPSGESNSASGRLLKSMLQILIRRASSRVVME